MTDKQMQKVAQMIIEEMKAHNVIIFKEKEEAVVKKAFEIIKADFQREAALDNEVNKMMDDLERKNAGEFQRYKMFPLLKKKLAKDKGIIL